MTKRPTFKESWLTGEVPLHPTLQMALHNAVLRAREVLAGQQEKTVRELWDTLDTVLEKVGKRAFSLTEIGALLVAPWAGREDSRQDSYRVFVIHKSDPDIQRILDKVPKEEVVATLILGEVDRGNIHTAVEWAAAELDPIREKENLLPDKDPYLAATRLLPKAIRETWELKEQAKNKAAAEMGSKGGSRGKKRREDVVKHAIRRVSEKIGSTKSNKVINAFDNADLMADLKDALSDPIRLEVLGVDYEKKEIRYRRLSDGRDDKFTFKTLQNHLSKINKTR